MASNFNVTPYYDDYDVNSGYLKILFKPGNSVQARELTQIQSILQQQIANVSDHFFKEGAMIIPGQSAIDTDISYLKIENQGNSVTYNSAADFVGRVVVGSTTGIRALVVHAENATGSTDADDPDTLYVKFISGADISDYSSVDFVEGDSISFLEEEVLTTESVSSMSDFACQIKPASDTPTGKGSIAFIESGVYYLQKHLVMVNDQKIVLDKYSNKPSYKIGLQVNEAFVNSNMDTTLLDNAQGTTNFNSPGADRYRISLVFSKRSIDEVDTSNFIELISVRNGVVESHVRTTEYSVLEETLARRTYDESGDYTVRPYEIDIRELLNENGNRGVSTLADFEFSNEVDAKEMARTRFFDEPDMIDLATGNGQAHTATPNDRTKYPEQNLDATGTKFYPGKTHDSLVAALRNRLAIGIEPGKSYVRGYELETLVTQFVDYKKSRDHIQKNNEYLTTKLGNFVYLTDVMGLPIPNQTVDLLNINVNGNDHVKIGDNPQFNAGDGSNSQGKSTYDKNQITADFSTWSSNNPIGADVIGTAKIRYVEHYAHDQNLDFSSGNFAPTNSDTDSAIYKVYLYDIKMEINPRTSREYLLNDLRSIESQSVAGAFNLFNGNVLVEYTLVDQLASFDNKNIVYSEYQDSGVRGVVYYSTSNKILVKTLGAGNPSSVGVGELNPRLFESNEVIREVEYDASPENAFSGSTNHDIGITPNNARVISRNVIFDTSGSSIVDTGSDFVKTIRFVDDDSGNTSVDTSYTVQMKFENISQAYSGTGSQIQLTLGTNSNQVFGSFNEKYYFAYTPTSGSGVPVVHQLTSSNVTLSTDANNRVTTATINLETLDAGNSVIVYAPVIKTNAAEKTKTLVQDQVIFPFAGRKTDGTSVAIESYASNPSSTWYAGDLYGLNNTAGVFNSSTTDGLGNSLALTSLQLEHSDIFELTAVYDTCNVTNVVYQIDSVGTKKFYNEMTATELKFALDAYLEYEETGVNPTGFAETPAKIVDITDRYTLDNGQRTGMYDLGDIKIQPGQSECAGRVAIVYSYFDHSTGGDYFSADSYTHSTSGVLYSQIPSFKETRLSDVLDFRPQTVAADLFTEKSLATPLKFGQISTTSNTPLDSSYVIADYRQYLPRKDKVYLSKEGDFLIKYGAPSVSPNYPEDPNDGMVIYKLATDPYSLGTESIAKEMLDNKRYTMRDIGNLEKRIKTVEYYTTLSLLEKETKDMDVLDDNGLDRFKNGFVVEPFTGHTIGDVFDPQYNCAIDVVNKELRPVYYQKNSPMRFNQSESTLYDIKDGMVMLPYTSVILAGQGKSSKTVSVNPYAIMGFKGYVKLFPEQDDWKDTSREPDDSSSPAGSIGAPDWPPFTRDADDDQDDGAPKGVDPVGTFFIRERNVFFHASGMKPKTRVFAFFDGTPVSQFCTTTKTIKVTGVASADNFIQTYESEIIDNTGDMTLVNNQGHEVRVVGIQYVDATTLNFYVIDNIDTNSFAGGQALFLVGPNFTNGISPGKFALETGSNSSTLITDESGNLRGIFAVPNTDQMRFRTGDKIFKLSDQQTSTAFAQTEAEGLYSAKTKLDSTTSTRQQRYSSQFVQSNGSVRNQIGEGSNQFNPIAQTVMTDKIGGAFLTSVNIFFSSKDSVIPVSVELRNTVGGYPGKTVLTRKTLYPSNVLTSSNGSLATNFLFDAPVYIEQGVEYAVVVLADSQDYSVHVARLGENSLDGTGTISKQPYSGVFFKAASTSWAPEQMEDMKFTLFRAQFDTNVSSSLYFENSSTDKLGYAANTVELGPSSIETFAGQDTVRFHVPNHDLIPSTGLNTHYYVTIAGLNSNARYGGDDTTNAWLGSELNGTHEVTATTLHTFDILMTNVKYIGGNSVAGTSKASTLASSGRFNPSADAGGKVTAEVNSKFDVLVPTIQTLQLPQTNVTYSLKTTSGLSQDSDMITGVKDSSWTNFVPNKDISFDTPRAVYSSYNENNFGSGSSNFEKKSLVYKLTLSSTQDNISPVIDTQRISSTLISNVVNYPIWTTTTDSQGNSTDTSSNYAQFISERESTGGTVESKYITKEIQLNQPATSLKIVLSMHRPQDADVDLYYKIKTSDSQEYRKLNYEYIDRPEGYAQSTTGLNQFTEFDYDVKGLSEFSSFGIKVVMRTKNSAMPPRLKDLRIIALAN